MTTVQLPRDNSAGRSNGLIKIGMARQWAIEHCPSFIQDDVLFDFKTRHYNLDDKPPIVVNMRFADPEDAVYFRLMWA